MAIQALNPKTPLCLAMQEHTPLQSSRVIQMSATWAPDMNNSTVLQLATIVRIVSDQCHPLIEVSSLRHRQEPRSEPHVHGLKIIWTDIFV